MPELTPEAVSAVLAAAGLAAAYMVRERPRSAGFHAFPITCTEDQEIRIAIDWHSLDYPRRAPDPRHPDPMLARCASALRAAGYLTERASDSGGEYLTAWTRGEF
jgi:hypothetical protein